MADVREITAMRLDTLVYYSSLQVWARKVHRPCGTKTMHAKPYRETALNRNGKLFRQDPPMILSIVAMDGGSVTFYLFGRTSSAGPGDCGMLD